MSAEEVAKTVVYLLGRAKITLLERIAGEVGASRIAEASGVNASSVSSALSRKSLGDKLAEKIFTGIARKYPEILLVQLKKIMAENREAWEKTRKHLEKLVEEKTMGQ